MAKRQNEAHSVAAQLDHQTLIIHFIYRNDSVK